MNIEEFAKKFPIGTPVWYYPIAGRPGRESTNIRSEPWELGCGEIVVKVGGRAGGVSVDHLIATVKVLEVKDSDFDPYQDWLIGDAAKKFVEGRYTHIRQGGETNAMEDVITLDDGSPNVMIGEAL